MVNAQEWLNNRYHNKNDTKRIQLDYYGNLISGWLTVEDYPNLEVLILESNMVENTRLSSLTVINCPKLKKINCPYNNLRFIKLSKLPSLEELDCSKNNFTSLGNNSLSLDTNECPNLKRINCDESYLTKLYIKGLNDLTNLTNLNLSWNKLTYPASYLKYLPNPEKLVSLRLHKNEGFRKNLTFLKNFVNLEEIWLGDNNFFGSLKPLKNMSKLKKLDISNTDVDSGLEYLPEDLEVLYCTGKLAKRLEDYVKKGRNYDYQEWRKDNSDLVNKTQNKSKNDFNYNKETNAENSQGKPETLEEISEELSELRDKNNKNYEYNMSKAQEQLDRDYPNKKKRAMIAKLDISGNKYQYEGSLKLEGFTNLEELNCSYNSLTNIDFSPLNPEKLTSLDLGINNFTAQNLECFSHFSNLKRLTIRNIINSKDQQYYGYYNTMYNRFYGSLKPLRNLVNLEYLDISGTDIDSGLEYLNLDKLTLNCLPSETRESKVAKIYSLYKEWESVGQRKEEKKKLFFAVEKMPTIQDNIQTFFINNPHFFEPKKLASLKGSLNIAFYSKLAGKLATIAGGGLATAGGYYNHPNLSFAGGLIAMSGSLLDAASSEWEKRLEKSCEKAKKDLENNSDVEGLKNNYQELVKIHGDLSLSIISNEPTNSEKTNEAYFVFRNAMIELRKEADKNLTEEKVVQFIQTLQANWNNLSQIIGNLCQEVEEYQRTTQQSQVNEIKTDNSSLTLRHSSSQEKTNTNDYVVQIQQTETKHFPKNS